MRSSAIRLKFWKKLASLNTLTRWFKNISRMSSITLFISERSAKSHALKKQVLITEELGVTACRKGRLKIPEEPFRNKDWAGQINELARPEAYKSPFTPIVSASLKDDLHSFRGGRNLVDHKTRSLREEKRRQMQFADRMMQGPRLVAELLALKRRTK